MTLKLTMPDGSVAEGSAEEIRDLLALRASTPPPPAPPREPTPEPLPFPAPEPPKAKAPPARTDDPPVGLVHMYGRRAARAMGLLVVLAEASRPVNSHVLARRLNCRPKGLAGVSLALSKLCERHGIDVDSVVKKPARNSDDTRWEAGPDLDAALAILDSSLNRSNTSKEV